MLTGAVLNGEIAGSAAAGQTDVTGLVKAIASGTSSGLNLDLS